MNIIKVNKSFIRTEKLVKLNLNLVLMCGRVTTAGVKTDVSKER